MAQGWKVKHVGIHYAGGGQVYLEGIGVKNGYTTLYESKADAAKWSKQPTPGDIVQGFYDHATDRHTQQEPNRVEINGVEVYNNPEIR